MPRTRAQARLNPFLDIEAVQGGLQRGERDRARLSARDAAIYNRSIPMYERNLNAYATAHPTRLKPALVKSKRRKHVTLIMKKKRARADEDDEGEAELVHQVQKKLVHQRLLDELNDEDSDDDSLRHPKRAKIKHIRRRPTTTPYNRVKAKQLEEQGVRTLTYCVHQRKKTGNIDSHVIAFIRKGHRKYRLASICSECKGRKSTFLAGSEPTSIYGGRLMAEA
jgi:5-methylcytosine-specific restriction endonuclease McrA